MQLHDDRPERHRITLPERVGNEASQRLHGRAVRAALGVVFRVLEHVHGAVDDDAAPVEEPFHFVDFQRHPGMVSEHLQLPAGRGAKDQRSFGIDEADRLDVYPVVKGVGQTSDAVPDQHCLALGRRQTTEGRRSLRR